MLHCCSVDPRLLKSGYHPVATGSQTTRQIRVVPDPDISMVHKFADKPVDFAASSSPRHAEIRRVLSVAQFAGGLEIAREADSVVIAPSAPHGDNA